MKLIKHRRSRSDGPEYQSWPKTDVTHPTSPSSSLSSSRVSSFNRIFRRSSDISSTDVAFTTADYKRAGSIVGTRRPDWSTTVSRSSTADELAATCSSCGACKPSRPVEVSRRRSPSPDAAEPDSSLRAKLLRLKREPMLAVTGGECALSPPIPEADECPELPVQRIAEQYVERRRFSNDPAPLQTPRISPKEAKRNKRFSWTPTFGKKSHAEDDASKRFSWTPRTPIPDSVYGISPKEATTPAASTALNVLDIDNQWRAFFGQKTGAPPDTDAPFGGPLSRPQQSSPELARQGTVSSSIYSEVQCDEPPLSDGNSLFSFEGSYLKRNSSSIYYRKESGQDDASVYIDDEYGDEAFNDELNNDDGSDYDGSDYDRQFEVDAYYGQGATPVQESAASPYLLSPLAKSPEEQMIDTLFDFEVPENTVFPSPRRMNKDLINRPVRPLSCATTANALYANYIEDDEYLSDSADDSMIAEANQMNEIYDDRAGGSKGLYRRSSSVIRRKANVITLYDDSMSSLSTRSKSIKSIRSDSSDTIFENDLFSPKLDGDILLSPISEQSDVGVSA